MAAYLDFFHLSQRPFTGTAHRRSAVATPPIRETAEQVRRLLGDEWPVLCVTGSPGIGKTHLALAIGSLVGDGFLWVRVESSLAWNEISRAAAETLGLADGSLNAAGLAAIRNRGKRIVFLIDHAERLNDECLANLEALVLQKLPSDQQIVQCVLLARNPGGSHDGRGLHAWLGHLGAPEIDFDPLPCDAVSTYIERHLSWAGHDGSEIFSQDAGEFLHAITGGIPEVLSRQCEHLLEEAAAEGIHLIDRTFAARVFGRGDLGDASPDEFAAAPPAELELHSETAEGVDDRASEPVANDDELLSDLADGFLERLDAWEPGQPEPGSASAPSTPSPIAPAPIEAMAEAEIDDVLPPPASSNRRVSLMNAVAALVIAVVGLGVWQFGPADDDSLATADPSEVVLAVDPPPASIAMDPGQTTVGTLETEATVSELGQPPAEDLAADDAEMETVPEPLADLAAETTEVSPTDDVEAPKVEIVTAITVDVRMRRRHPLALERTASDYEAN
jgi:type II secretory pathway predicted ATPase ExeA